MSEQKCQQNVSAFQDWLFRKGIRITQSLKEKLCTANLDSIDALIELKLMNGTAELFTYLDLNIIDKVALNTIIRKIEVPASYETISSQFAAITPSLISIKDNKNGTVDIKLKLVQTAAALNNDNKNKLILEWAEDEKALDIGHKTGVVVDLDDIQMDTVQEMKNIPLKANADAFRLVWRHSSNIKSLKLRCEQWDAHHKGGVIAVSDNIIEHKGSKDCWQSIYGTIICKQTFVYHWKFRVKTYRPYLMFGVEKVANNYGLSGTYAGAKAAAYYSYCEVAYIYSTQDGQSLHGDYGSKRMNQNGGEFDMYLDLKKYELRFETNGVDVGYKIGNLSEENYRMVASLHTPGVRIELVTFDVL